MGNLKLKKFYNRILVSNAPFSQANGVYELSSFLANGLRYYVKGADIPGNWAIAAGKESIFSPFTWAIYQINVTTFYYSINSSFNSIFDLPQYPWECSGWVDQNQSPLNIKLEPYSTLTKNSISIKKQNLTVSEGSILPPGINPNGIYLLQNSLINGKPWYGRPLGQVPIGQDAMIRMIYTTQGWIIQYNLNNWLLLTSATNVSNNPWEATWPNNIRVSLGSGGKLNLNKSSI